GVLAECPRGAEYQDVIAAAFQGGEHGIAVREAQRIEVEAGEALFATIGRTSRPWPIELVIARWNAERLAHGDIVDEVGVHRQAVELRRVTEAMLITPAQVQERPAWRQERPPGERGVLVENRVVVADEEDDTMLAGARVELKIDADRAGIGFGQI